MSRSTTRQEFHGPAVRPFFGALVLAVCALSLAGCDSSGSPESRTVRDVPVTTANLDVLVKNELGAALVDVPVTVEIGSLQFVANTGSQGRARFTGLPLRDSTVTVEADGYETWAYVIGLQPGEQAWDAVLKADGAWALARALVLGTDTVDLAADGTSLTFSVDVAVVSGETLQPVTNLADSNFRIYTIECGWGGSRDCASDAAGNLTGAYGIYSTDGVASAFELRSASTGAPWIAGVLVEPFWGSWDRDTLGPALKSFLAGVGGDNAVGLASLAIAGWWDYDYGEATTLTVHGPFTSDGAVYAADVDTLGEPTADGSYVYEGRLQASLLHSIEWTATAAGDFPGRTPTLLLAAQPFLSLAEIDEAVTLARDAGVRISAIGGYHPELALRTGGFIMDLDDARQYATAFGAMNRALAGELPFYRMQFTVTGDAGTFVPGGNARIYLHMDTPSPILNRGAQTVFDVTIAD